MGAIDVLYSSPIPVALAMGFNVILLAVFYFYVFPLQEEVKALRLRSAEFDTKYMDSVVVISDSVEVIEQMSDKLNEIHVFLKTPNADVAALASVCTSILTVVQDIRSSASHGDPRKHAELLSLIEALERNSERILRTVSDVSDKQSQVTGIMLGMGMQRHSGDGPRGV